MAAYFSGNGTDIQSADGLQTLYLMNPGYVGFTDSGVPAGNVVLINHHGGDQFPGSQQQFVGIPLPATAQSFMGNTPIDVNLGFMASNLRQHNNLWRNTGRELPCVQSIDPDGPTAAAAAAATNSTGNPFQISTIANTSTHQPIPNTSPSQHSMHGQQQGGLSLSLSSNSVQFMVAPNSFQTDAEAMVVAPTIGSDGGCGDDRKRKWEGGLQSALLGSKYLKAAQELLGEVVNVGKGLKTEATMKSPAKDEKSKKESASTCSDDQNTAKKGSELTASERQEFQMKKAKLVTMLEEVDQRYKQYHHQIQMVVSSFEDAAGAGAAKTYTELALQTMSKQFRCLRDAISGQIRLTNRNLGEEDCIGTGKVEGSRLRYVDQHLRQQRALQHLGMMQHNAWRPQRGLPERSVSVLRAWLFEHFLHPYPKDADKHMLAKQTRLTRSQVSNWFINARVRLWKPMVEEMYMEETKGNEKENSDDKTGLSEINEDSAAMKSTTDSPIPNLHQKLSTNWNQQMDSSTGPGASPGNISAVSTAMSSLGNLRTAAGFGLIESSSPDAHIQLLDNESVIKEATPKRTINNGLQGFVPFPSDESVKPSEGVNFGGFTITDRHGRPGYGFSDGFGAYQIDDVSRYSHDTFAPRINTNGVSLTLGLPHCDSVLSLSGAQSPYLPSPNMQLGRRHELGSEPANDFCTLNPAEAAAAASHSPNGYENLNNIHASRKRFAAQLLPDFVT